MSNATVAASHLTVAKANFQLLFGSIAPSCLLLCRTDTQREEDWVDKGNQMVEVQLIWYAKHASDELKRNYVSNNIFTLGLELIIYVLVTN